MISDRALAAIKTWIEANEGSLPVLADLDIRLRDIDSAKTYPLLVLRDAASEEHEILRGVVAITIEAALTTVPHADGASATATTQASHQAYADALESVLGDYVAGKNYMDAISGITVFNVRGLTGLTDEDEGRRTTTFEFLITCCNQ